jgi:hypothetical protein
LLDLFVGQQFRFLSPIPVGALWADRSATLRPFGSRGKLNVS